MCLYTVSTAYSSFNTQSSKGSAYACTISDFQVSCVALGQSSDDLSVCH